MAVVASRVVKQRQRKSVPMIVHTVFVSTSGGPQKGIGPLPAMLITSITPLTTRLITAVKSSPLSRTQ